MQSWRHIGWEKTFFPPKRMFDQIRSWGGLHPWRCVRDRDGDGVWLLSSGTDRDLCVDRGATCLGGCLP